MIVTGAAGFIGFHVARRLLALGHDVVGIDNLNAYYSPHGRLERDFTYVDDVVEAIVRLVERPPAGDPAWNAAAPDPATSSAPFRLYNIGNHTPAPVERLVTILEDLCGRKARRVYKPKPPGDVDATFADVSALTAAVGFEPATPLETGLARFVEWYRAWRGA